LPFGVFLEGDIIVGVLGEETRSANRPEPHVLYYTDQPVTKLYHRR